MKPWVHALLWLPLACGCFASCADDDAKKSVHGNAGGAGGEAPDPSAGGSEANPGTSGMGTAGTPGPVAAGTGGVSEGGAGPVAVAGGGGEGGVAELVCDALVPAGGVGGDPYGGAQWKDYAANTCRSCPSADLICDDFVLDPPATYDAATRVLSLHLAPGKAEIANANFNYEYYDGQTYPTAIGVVAIDKNDLNITLDALTAEPGYVSGDLLVKDGCGDLQEMTSDSAVDDWFELQRIDPPVGGAGGEGPVTYQVRCVSD